MFNPVLIQSKGVKRRPRKRRYRSLSTSGCCKACFGAREGPPCGNCAKPTCGDCEDWELTVLVPSGATLEAPRRPRSRSCGEERQTGARFAVVRQGTSAFEMADVVVCIACKNKRNVCQVCFVAHWNDECPSCTETFCSFCQVSHTVAGKERDVNVCRQYAVEAEKVLSCHVSEDPASLIMKFL